jgi:dTDP-4-dehydrorhamnose 3,5-epimerase
MIEGVVLKDLVTNCDERGFFREIIRVNDDFFKEGFGQWSHALLYQGVTKAWHIHKRQVDWWYIATGLLKVCLHDTRKDSPTHGELMTFFMGENQPGRVLRIPPGVAHGCKAIGGTVNFLYITSHIYDTKDEGRIPHDDASIGYDWASGPPIT